MVFEKGLTVQQHLRFANLLHLGETCNLLSKYLLQDCDLLSASIFLKSWPLDSVIYFQSLYFNITIYFHRAHGTRVL